MVNGVTGLLAAMLVLSLPAGCSAQHQKCAAADIDSDGDVDVEDMLRLLSAFGSCNNAAKQPSVASPAKTVARFYAAIDMKDFSQLSAVTSARFSASFAAGCATVGGAHHCGEGVLDRAGFVKMLKRFGPRPGGTIQRTFATAGGVVTNHYAVRGGSHGAAVHHVVGGRVVSSFWYGGSVGANGTTAVAVVRRFYAAIDQNPATAGGVNDLRKLVGAGYSAHFGSGCASVGGARRCGEGTLGAGGLIALVRGRARQRTMQRKLTANGGTVLNHYVTKDLNGGVSHGAAIHQVLNGVVSASFWYSDKDWRVRTVEQLYRAIDTRTLLDLGPVLAPGWTAVFGSGSATIGGARWTPSSYSSSQNLTQFKKMLSDFPPNCRKNDAVCLSKIERQFVTQGDSVINHYTQWQQGKVVNHAVAVHQFQGSKLVGSFWYSEQTPQTRKVVQAFYEIVDDVTNGVRGGRTLSGLDALCAKGASRIFFFSPGAASVGRAIHRSTKPTTMTLAEFKRFLANPPAKGPLPDPQCVGAQRTKCIQRQLVAQGDSVVNHYVVRDSNGRALNSGVSIFRFDHTAKLLSVYWYSG